MTSCLTSAYATLPSPYLECLPLELHGDLDVLLYATEFRPGSAATVISGNNRSGLKRYPRRRGRLFGRYKLGFADQFHETCIRFLQLSFATHNFARRYFDLPAIICYEQWRLLLHS